MEALTYKVLDMKGKEVGTIDLDPEVFGAKIDKTLVHETVRWQLARRRAGTHSTLTKGMMRGGNRKPWRQKGTGRARSGSNTSPVWVGGGVSHGPQPRDYDFRLPKRTRRQALAAVLSDKVKGSNLRILDSLSVDSGKTKDMVAILNNLGLANEKLALVLPADAEQVVRSSNNLKNVIALPLEGVNVYDLMKSKYVVSTRDGILALQSRIKGEAQAE